MKSFSEIYKKYALYRHDHNLSIMAYNTFVSWYKITGWDLEAIYNHDHRYGWDRKKPLGHSYSLKLLKEAQEDRNGKDNWDVGEPRRYMQASTSSSSESYQLARRRAVAERNCYNECCRHDHKRRDNFELACSLALLVWILFVIVFFLKWFF